MPPKRKRVDDAGAGETSSASRSTRSSSRISANKSAGAEAPPAEPLPKKKKPQKSSASTKAASTIEKQVELEGEEPSERKKATTKATKKALAEQQTASQKAPIRRNHGHSEDAPIPSTSKSLPSQDATTTTSSPLTQPDVPLPYVPAQQPPVATKPTIASSLKTPSFKNEPYSAQRSLSLFAQYADGDDANVIGPDGFETLCTDANIPLEGALPLILAWQMDAKEMAKFSKEEWVKGTGSLKISTLPQLSLALNELQNLLVLQQPPMKKSLRKDQDPYDRTAYFSYAEDPKISFQKLYQYCFSLAKQEGSRNIDMEVFVYDYSKENKLLAQMLYQTIIDVNRLLFITEKGTYRATNKDLWSMMLEFCRTVKLSLEDYEADGAWPTLLDDFVTWKKRKNTD